MVRSFALLLLTAALAPLASAADITIKVTNFKFTPNNVKAKKGDKITFQFGAGNHSVVQSTLAKPCAPLAGGFFSGYEADATDTKTTDFSITLPSDDPFYFYCSQEGHCIEGMWGVVNPPSSDTVKTLTDNVKSSKGGDPDGSPSNHVVDSGSSGSSSSASGSSTGGSSPTSTTGNSNSTPHSTSSSPSPSRSNDAAGMTVQWGVAFAGALVAGAMAV